MYLMYLPCAYYGPAGAAYYEPTMHLMYSLCTYHVLTVDPQELQKKVVGFLYQMRIDAEVKCAARPCQPRGRRRRPRGL